jgi:hypothetical protein
VKNSLSYEIGSTIRYVILVEEEGEKEEEQKT